MVISGIVAMDVSMAESCSGVAEMGEVGVGMSLQANTCTGRSGRAQTLNVGRCPFEAGFFAN
jgi:hypothetical protein